MKKNSVLQEEYEVPNYIYVTEYDDMIEYNIQNIPDKRTKEYKLWLKRMNELVTKVNKLAGHIRYNKFYK